VAGADGIVYKNAGGRAAKLKKKEDMKMLERLSTNVTLDQIFDDLYNLISEANRIPLTDKIIVEESDLSAILDDLKEAIPKEVKRASEVLTESQKIMSSAKEEAAATVEKANLEAEHIITAAKEEADRLVRQEEIVRQAEMLSKDIKTSAQRYEDEVKQGADQYADQVKTDSLQYADDMLGYLGNSLQSALRAIEDNRNSVNEERKGLAELIASRVQHVAVQPEAIPAPATAEEAEEAPAEED
jgi:cell division septum initiation protein DivIVA